MNFWRNKAWGMSKRDAEPHHPPGKQGEKGLFAPSPIESRVSKLALRGSDSAHTAFAILTKSPFSPKPARWVVGLRCAFELAKN